MLREAFNFLDSYDDAEEWLCLRVVALGDMTPNGSVRESIKRGEQKTRVRKIKDFHYTVKTCSTAIIIYPYGQKNLELEGRKIAEGPCM